MAKSNPSETAAVKTPIAGNVTVQHFTEAVFNGVLRALDARKPGLPKGRIIYGIIWDPALGTVAEAGGIRGSGE